MSTNTKTTYLPVSDKGLIRSVLAFYTPLKTAVPQKDNALITSHFQLTKGGQYLAR